MLGSNYVPGGAHHLRIDSSKKINFSNYLQLYFVYAVSLLRSDARGKGTYTGTGSFIMGDVLPVGWEVSTGNSFFSIRYHGSSSSIKCHVYHHVGGRRHTPVVCNESREPHTSHYPSRPVTQKQPTNYSYQTEKWKRLFRFLLIADHRCVLSAPT